MSVAKFPFAPAWLIRSLMESGLSAPTSMRWLAKEQPFAERALREFAEVHGLEVIDVQTEDALGKANRMIWVETPSHHAYEVVL